MSLLAQTSTQQLVTSSITAVTAQFQTITTQTFSVSSINGIVPGAAFSGSTIGLSSATITTSTLGTNSLTTSSITSYGNVDIKGSVLSNVASEYFVKPLFTSIFTPTSIPGLKVWLDASKLTSITSNGSAQVTVLSNLTGFGNALSNSGITPPTTGTYSINNLNTLSFTGQNSLKLPSIAYTSSDRSLFVVAQTTGNSAFYGVGSNAGSITASLYSTYYYGWERNNVTQQNLGTAIYNTPFLVTIYKTSTSNGIILNGSNLGATPTTFTPGTYVDQIGVAGSPTGNIGPEYYGASWNFAEAIVYDGPLTPSQRQTVEGYLAWKWGLQASLILTHPYAFTVPPPFGTDYIPTGSITSDANSNVSFTANNKLRLIGPVEIPTTLSTASLTVSTINGQTIGQPIQSTVTGLGTAGYISTSQLYSTVQGIGSGFTGSTIGLSAATINTSTLNTRYLSSVQGYVSSLRTDSLTVGGPTGYVTVQDLTTATISTGQIAAGAGFISSLQINSLSFGPSGYVIVSNFIANTLSTTKLNAQNIYGNNIYVGNTSTQSAILFPGTDGNYRGTAIAEQTTGVGTGELLLYKVSSTTDQIRLQTTGSIVFEAGAASRSWNSTTQLATPTLYIAGSTSNVGIGTATPSYPLDVTGTARAQRVIAQPSGTTSATSVSPLAVTNGNAYLSFSPQIEFQYNSGGYKHFMGSRHNGNFVNNFGNAIDFWLYSAASGGSTASTAPNTGNVNTLSVTAAGVGIFNNSPAYALDVIGIINTQTSIQAPLLSTLNINLSSINGTAQWQESYLTSTSQGLATAGYISSTQLTSTVTNLITRIGAGGGGGTTFVGSTTFLSASQVLFSTQTGYNISSVLGFVSSLQVDELQIGTGFGIIAFGDTNMSSISTLGIAAGLGNFTTINVSSINGAIPGTGSGGTTFTGTLGTVSSLTALRFFGLTGTYANTAVAEVSTGTGTQELLLYKVSSIADQVRVQTTGNVIFETGVGARGWPVATRATVPTFYVAGSNSNVGIGTSNPVTTLDVAGTGRFQTLSSLNITAGSINYSVAFV